jgi:hypothetical protein
MHPFTLWFASKGAPWFTGPTLSGYSWSCQVPRAPLHDRGVPSLIVVSKPRQQVLPCVIAHTGSCVSPQPSSCLGRTLGHQVCAGCGQPLLGGGPSRRCLCVSFPACLDPYPGGSCGAHTRFFPHDSGLPPVRTGSALHHVRTATSVRRLFRGCSHSLMFRPAGLLATPVAPTDINTMWQPWLLRPSLSRFVTSPCPGYANRPNRAIDGMGTFTPSDTQPCRLLPKRWASAAAGSRSEAEAVGSRLHAFDND